MKKLPTTNYKRHNSAFTLVELSIVMIIIGLMVSGVLAGQSLIQSAKRQALIGEYKTIDTSFMAFHLEYNAIPGDFDEAWDYWGTDCADTELNCNGDGNGKIDSYYSNAYGETAQAWNHLALAAILPAQEEDIGYSGNANFYNTSYENSKFIPYYKNFHYFNAWQKQQKHMLYFWGAKAGQFTGSWLEGGIGGKDMYNIDKKIDNGLPRSGNIIARDARDALDWDCENNDEYVKSSNNIQMCVAGFYLSL